MSKKPAAISPAPPSKPLTREQIMDQRAAADFAKMDRINSDRTVEYRVMNERDPNPLGPVPSERNRASQAVFTNSDLTFSQVGESHFGGSNYMRSRRRF
jgi:hypothetical protein